MSGYCWTVRPAVRFPRRIAALPAAVTAVDLVGPVCPRYDLQRQQALILQMDATAHRICRQQGFSRRDEWDCVWYVTRALWRREFVLDEHGFCAQDLLCRSIRHYVNDWRRETDRRSVYLHEKTVRFGRWRGLSSEEAAACAQDCVRVMLEKYGRKLQPRQYIPDIDAYLRTCAYRRVIDHMRTLNLTGAHNAPFSETTPDPAYGPEAAILRIRTTEDVETALKHLDPEQRQYIVRHFLDGESYVQIAATLGRGVTADAIRMKVNRAKKQLREWFQTHEMSAEDLLGTLQ